MIKRVLKANHFQSHGHKPSSSFEWFKLTIDTDTCATNRIHVLCQQPDTVTIVKQETQFSNIVSNPGVQNSIISKSSGARSWKVRAVSIDTTITCVHSAKILTTRTTTTRTTKKEDNHHPIYQDSLDTHSSIVSQFSGLAVKPERGALIPIRAGANLSKTTTFDRVRWWCDSLVWKCTEKQCGSRLRAPSWDTQRRRKDNRLSGFIMI